MDISRETRHAIIGTVEDAVAYELEEARKSGELVSGECAANVVLCYYMAKVAEFEGLIAPKID